MKKIKTFLFSVYAWLSFDICLLFWGIGSDLIVPFDRKEKARYVWQRWKANILSFLLCSKVHMQGEENLNKGGQIIAPNHCSYFDIVSMVAKIKLPLSWIAKRELLMWPILGWHIRSHGCIPINRSNRKKAILSMQLAAERLSDEKKNLVVFPEGTRSRNGEIGPLKKGAFHLSKDSGCPLVPLYMRGTGNIIKPDTFAVGISDVYMKFGEPLQPTDYKDVDELLAAYQERLLQLKTEVDEWYETETSKKDK